MRAKNFIASVLDPRAWIHLLRLVHFFNYSHVEPRRRMAIGPGTVLAPNVSLRNGERISIGHHGEIGERARLWAGNAHGKIVMGDYAFIGPDVFITVANYETPRGQPVRGQAKIERDVIIGDNVWLGTGVMVMPGVEIGDGCIIGAGAVVTHSLPPESIAVGVPAKVVGERT